MTKKTRGSRPNAAGVAPGTAPAMPSGHGTTGGRGPGGPGTGLSQRTDVLGLTGSGGPATGGMPPVAATGGTGDSAGGLAEGTGGIGGGRIGSVRERRASGPTRVRMADGDAGGERPDTPLDVDRPTPGAGVLDDERGKPL